MAFYPKPNTLRNILQTIIRIQFLQNIFFSFIFDQEVYSTVGVSREEWWRSVKRCVGSVGTCACSTWKCSGFKGRCSCTVGVQWLSKEVLLISRGGVVAQQGGGAVVAQLGAVVAQQRSVMIQEGGGSEWWRTRLVSQGLWCNQHLPSLGRLLRLGHKPGMVLASSRLSSRAPRGQPSRGDRERKMPYFGLGSCYY